MKIHRSKVAFAQKVIDSSSEGISQTMIQVGLGLKLHGLTTMVSVCSSVQLKSAQSKDLNLHPRLYNRGFLRRRIKYKETANTLTPFSHHFLRTYVALRKNCQYGRISA